MNPARDGIGEQEVRYFGKVSASVSHELKNVLAILNEHAGLLQDFVAMAEQGQPLDVERIRRLSSNMLRQIGRGDVIVKRMNRFAHSADLDRATVDVGELATMVVEMFARTATNRGVRVEVKPATVTVSVQTNPFALETLLGSLIDRLTTVIPGIGTLVIELVSHAGGGRVRIPGLAKHADMVEGLLKGEDFDNLLAALRAHAACNPEDGALVITLPGQIDT